MKLLILFVVFCAIASLVESVRPEDPEEPEWKHYKGHHRRRFRSKVDEFRRRKTFGKNLVNIKNHNQKFKDGKVTFEMSVNAFTDLPHSEFVRRFNGLRKSSAPPNVVKKDNRTRLRSIRLPEGVDWREKNVITPVRDQSTCGSCWTFASVAAIEAHGRIKEKDNGELSEQNILDCADEELGCDGGHMIPAFSYFKSNNGISYLNYYKYENAKGPCRSRVSYLSKVKPSASGPGYVRLPSGDEDKLKEVIATVGPVAIGIDAELDTFQHYKRGVYYDAECSSDAITHAVLAVGYGIENGQSYWLIKNSWGATWGDRGYVKIARNRKNHCGVATDPVYPTV